MSLNPRKLKELEPVFYPKSVAVVGVSADERKMGNIYLESLLAAGFKGKLYPVNPQGGQIEGLPIHPGVKAIPEPVDYVIVAIPKRFVLDLLDDCAAKGVKVVQIFSAGFSELETEEGRGLELDLVSKARKWGIRIIGPNCLGVHCPESGMHLPVPVLKQEGKGSVAFIGQSGGHTGAFARLGFARGIKFSKMVSFGNGYDLDSVDFLEYLALDPETEIITAYLEGVRDGPRLLQIIKETSKTKPVIIWKGGVTEAGGRTASSHTAAVASSSAIWTAALKQAGAIQVESLEELADTALALQYLPRLEGNRIAVIAGITGAGGGACVAASDACASQGLEVPLLAEETRARLKDTLPPVGSILRNPVDVGAIAAFSGVEYLSPPMELVLEDPRIDVVIIHASVNHFISALNKEGFDAVIDTFIALRKSQHKPLVVVSPHELAEAERAEMERKLAHARIPVYLTFEWAAKAIANVNRYWKSRAEIHEEAA